MTFYERSEVLDEVLEKLREAGRLLQDASNLAVTVDAHGVARRIDNVGNRVIMCEGVTRSTIGRLQRRAIENRKDG